MDRTNGSPLSRVMVDLENNPALDSAVHATQPLFDLISANRTVQHALQGRWFGHALHPMLVALPIGAWISALVLDFTDSSSAVAARRLIGFGVLAAVPTALTGAAELSDQDHKIKRIGSLHSIANHVALGLQVGSWVSRRRSRAAGRLLSMAALAVVTGAGYLGGHMAIARKVGSHDRLFDAASSPAK